MTPGQFVIHKPSGRLFVVNSLTKGSPMVGCFFYETNAQGEKVERQTAVHWQELRSPTSEERKTGCAEPEDKARVLETSTGKVMEGGQTDATGGDEETADTPAKPVAPAKKTAKKPAKRGKETAPPGDEGAATGEDKAGDGVQDAIGAAGRR
jgi:hypothetical protein